MDKKRIGLSKSSIKKQFQEELKKGTGKAYFLFKHYHKNADLTEPLFQVCIHNPDYDPQCSGSRAVYLYEMIRMLPNHVSFENEILKEFLRTYHCSVDQLFDLAVLFAKSGNQNAREVMYKKFQVELKSPDGPGAGGYQITELDGIDGLLFVIKQRGRQLLTNKGDWEDDLLLDSAQTLIPRVNVKRVLKKEAIKDHFVKAYLKAVEQTEETRKKSANKWKLSYKKMKKLIRQSDKVSKVPMSWGWWASSKDFKAAANDLISETNEKYLTQYLRIFARKKFPLRVDHLLQWNRYKTKEMKFYAFYAIAHFKDRRVRDIGLGYLKGRKMISSALRTLEKNFQEEDVPFIEKALWLEKSPYEFHGAAMSAIDICQGKKTKQPLKILMPIYKRGYCANCRWRVIRALVRNRVLPKQIQKEALFDCNLDVRSYVKRYGGV